MPIITWFQWPVGLAFLGPIGLWWSRRWVLAGSYLQSTVQTAYQGTVFLWRPPGLSWSFILSSRLQVWQTVAYGVALKEYSRRCLLALFCHVPAHQHLPEKRLYTHLEAWFLQLLPRGHCQIAWPVRLMLVVPQECIHLHTFKAAAWGSGFQRAWF